MAALAEYSAQFEAVQPRPEGSDGDVEVLDGSRTSARAITVR